MLIDCERCRFPLANIFQEIDEGLYTYSGLATRLATRYGETVQREAVWEAWRKVRVVRSSAA